MAKTTGNLMSPLHITKLGHEIAEIRSRALSSIYSKYNLKLVDESNVENNKQLLNRLLEWFNFEKPCDEQKALNLILRVARCENFTEVVRDLNADHILKRIGDIEKKVDASFCRTISEMKDLILEARRKYGCPVVTEITINGNIPNINSKLEQCTNNVAKIQSPLLYLPWQSLVNGDRKILLSTYDGLRYVDNTSSILQNCQFLRDVILRDFPVEIFLQRPLLIWTLLELVRSQNVVVRKPVLHVLAEISKILNIRIRCLIDPCVRGTRWKRSLIEHSINDLDLDETEALGKNQMSITQFCYTVLTRTLSLLTSEVHQEERHILMCLITHVVHTLSIAEDTSKSVPNNFETCLIKYSKQPKLRLHYLTLLTNMLSRLQNTVDLSPALRKELFSNIGDPSLLLLFPPLHQLVVALSSEPQDQDLEELSKDFDTALRICASLESAKKLDKTKMNYFEVFSNVLLSLEFHKNVAIVRDFFKVCGSKVVYENDGLRTNVLLKLLSHSDNHIQLMAYEGLNALVLKFGGPESSVDCTGDRLDFLYHSEVWEELLMFGADSSNHEVQRLCRESLVTILKSKPVTSERVWSVLLTSLQPCFGLLTAYAGTNTPLGRHVIRLLEPGVAEVMGLPPTLLLTGNLQLLFCKEILVNEEAFARLCWVLVKDDPAEAKLPRISDIKGLHLSSVCVKVSQQPYPQPQPKFSTARALNEVLTILKNQETDANTRRSALGQLSAILEDSSLHIEFLQSDGLEMLLNSFNSALIEADLRNYPTSVIPITTMLKTLVMNHIPVRQALASQDSVILNILRSLLLFTADDVFRQVVVQLLFLLIFSDAVLEPLQSSRISLPNVIHQKMHIPLAAHIHAKTSLNSMPSNRAQLMGNPNTNRLIRVYWSALWMGDLSTLIALTSQDLEKDVFSPNLPGDMRVTSSDLEILQHCSLRHVMLRKLEDCQNADSHCDVMESIHELAGCLTWLETSRLIPPSPGPTLLLSTYADDLDSLPWAATFDRYLTTSPISMDDELLLSHVVSLLRQLIRALDSPAIINWITGLLTNGKGVFVDLWSNFGVAERGIARRDARYGMIYLAQDVIMRSPDTASRPWVVIIRLILKYLESDCGDHLDCLLSLLADITGAWTWDYGPYEELYKGLVVRVMEIIASFQRVSDSQNSFMGSNIISNALQVLGHLLSDVSIHVRGWEQVWQDALREAAGVSTLAEANYNWLISLVSYRDPITRAAALTLISGLFASARAFHLLVDGLDFGMGQIWTVALNVVLDDGECALVREKAALLLERLTALGSRTDCSEFLDYLKVENIYGHIGNITSALNCQQDLLPDLKDSLERPAATMGLVTALCDWIMSVLHLNKTKVAQQMVDSNLFHSLLSVTVVRENSREEWLRMNTSVVKLVRACVRACPQAREILLAAVDRIGSFCSLLHTYLLDGEKIPPDVEKLWQEVFYLLATILETPHGAVAFKKSLQTFDIKEVELVVCESLSSTTLRHRTLPFINNLATLELAFCFSHSLPKGSLAEVLCEILLSLDFFQSCPTLSSLFLISVPAQTFALRHGYVETVLLKLRNMAAELNVHAVDDFRKISAKRKIEPILDDMELAYQLLTNFCYQNLSVKLCLADSGLADAIYKVWPWLAVRPSLLQTTIKLLCTFSNQSEKACQSIALTSLHFGPRKGTLIQSIILLVGSEMNLLTKTGDSSSLDLSLQFLGNCCEALECRVAMAKGAVLAPLEKLLPTATSGTKKRHGEHVYNVWFQFLEIFTVFPEGQLTVCNDPTALELIFLTVEATNSALRGRALNTLVHLSFHPKNRCRLLTKPAALLNLLKTVLRSRDEHDVRLAAAILWSLSANSQKGKLILKTAGCVEALQQARRECKGDDCLRVLDQALIVLTDK